MGPKTAIEGTPSSQIKTRGARAHRLTATFINGLRSRPGESYDVYDGECPNLLLHVGEQRSDGADAAKSWQWRFYSHGKRAKLTIGKWPAKGIADAHNDVRDCETLLTQGIDPRKAGLARKARARTVAPPSQTTAAAAPTDPHSIEALCNHFMQRFIRPNRKHPDEVQRVLNKEILRPETWAGRDVRTIKPKDVIELLDGIVDRGSRVQANRVAATITQLFKFAIHRGLIENTPVQLLYAPGGTEKARSRVLSDAELTVLLTKADEVMKRAPRTVAAMKLILYTACRRSEIALAQWRHFHDLDGKKPTWSIPAELSKTEAECIQPLVPAAVEILKKLKQNAGRNRYVFPNGDADSAGDPKILTRSVARHLPHLKKVGVKEFVLHDLRRTVRTGLARLKVQPHIAERVLNHKQPGIVGVYDVFAYADEKRAALTQWADHLATLHNA